MHTIIASRTTLFPLSLVCATRSAVDDHDREANHVALERGGRLFSVYTTSLGTRLYIITECDRSATTMLLPSEY